jgi:hypothetical protein
MLRSHVNKAHHHYGFVFALAALALFGTSLATNLPVLEMAGEGVAGSLLEAQVGR